MTGARFWLLMPWLIIGAALASGCNGGGDSIDENNLVVNPGFEDGATGWDALSGELNITSEQSSSGGSSMLIEMRETVESPSHFLVAAFQEISPGEVPESLSFEYLVGHWLKGTERQYLEASVVVTSSDPRMPACPGGGPCPNIQLRYILGGVSVDPDSIGNVRYLFPGEENPAIGEWVSFETNFREDLAAVWGIAPEQVTKVRLQFEARFNGRSPSEGPLEADFYIDNVYFGPP